MYYKKTHKKTHIFLKKCRIRDGAWPTHPLPSFSRIFGISFNLTKPLSGIAIMSTGYFDNKNDKLLLKIQLKGIAKIAGVWPLYGWRVLKSSIISRRLLYHMSRGGHNPAHTKHWNNVGLMSVTLNQHFLMRCVRWELVTEWLPASPTQNIQNIGLVLD